MSNNRKPPSLVTPINRNTQPPQTNINVNPSDLDDLQCECGNYTFNPVVVLKKLPALISPSGKDGIVPMNVYSCVVCNQIPKELNDVLASWFKKKEEEGEVEKIDIQSSVLPGLEPIQ